MRSCSMVEASGGPVPPLEHPERAEGVPAARRAHAALEVEVDVTRVDPVERPPAVGAMGRLCALPDHPPSRAKTRVSTPDGGHARDDVRAARFVIRNSASCSVKRISLGSASATGVSSLPGRWSRRTRLGAAGETCPGRARTFGERLIEEPLSPVLTPSGPVGQIWPSCPLGRSRLSPCRLAAAVEGGSQGAGCALKRPGGAAGGE